MQWYDNPRHPIWTYILLITLIGSIFLFCALGYHHGIDWIDLKTILGPAGIAAFVEFLRWYCSRWSADVFKPPPDIKPQPKPPEPESCI